eukprot:TRINITY_DN8200_c0_g1_i4.p2 TRINITY_DN8200_c0_g1~~TRINITY_DN8200_c0_g1_i4.p2  ORF type:complete len:205 (+),score=39.00 TRINITY_DN8200_c0_g1_i4:108-722(+)
MAAPPSGAPSLPASTDTATKTSGITPTIENIVATGHFEGKIDLERVSKKALNTQYNPKRFAACIIRLKGQNKATALLFNSGKMVIMGAKSEQIAKNACDRFSDMIIKRCGIKTRLIEFKIHNVVGCVDVQFKIDLSKLYLEQNLFCKYDAEVFPGLTYRMHTPEVVLLIFHSGKIVLTKSKTREDVLKAFEKMYPVLQQFRVAE